MRPPKIWIDLDNSPHVPFFAPIIEELKKRGNSVLVTARDCFQVCELADLMRVQYKLIGKHYGKHKLLKVLGLGIRTAQLAPTVIAERPDVAVSHGSRSQLLLSAVLRVPSIVICDYEFARGLKALQPTWLMVPDVVAENGGASGNRVLRYPGIKEDVYVPRFKPDASIRGYLGLQKDDLVVTLRPPANEAHYHNPESEALIEAVLDRLGKTPNARIILLPRNHKQELIIRRAWPGLFDSGKMMVPAHAVDGLNLIWYSDLVISGGGTMNREAAALGVPVYSIFRGKIGAVDRYLAQTGRLVLVERAGEVATKILLDRRQRPAEPASVDSGALSGIVDNVASVLASRSQRRAVSATQVPRVAK
jgi:predicted glycosyltransferase